MFAPHPRAGLVGMILGLALAGTAAAAPIRFFSYDPADEQTRLAAGGLTFEFKQHLVSTEVLRIRASEGPATAELRRASAEALGKGGLTALIGSAPERDLYEIRPEQEGAAMIAALCPGARRAWMAFDRLRAEHSARVFLFADGPTGPVRICRTLAFNFRGEWSLPNGPPLDEQLPPATNFPH
jgi:hypothetical protein